MDFVKAFDCPLTLSIEQWATVLRCVRKSQTDPKIAFDLERELRIQLDQAVARYRERLIFEVFEAEDDELDDTQEIERPNIAALEEELQPVALGAVDVSLFGMVCTLLITAVWAVL